MNENAQKRIERTAQLKQLVQDILSSIDPNAMSVTFWQKLCQICSDGTPEADYKSDPEYLAADKFYREFTSQGGVDYSHAVSYAREQLNAFEKSDKTHDEKADSIVKYLAGGTSLITMAALLSVRFENQKSIVATLVVLIALMPTLFCAIMAIDRALDVRRPRGAANLPKIDWAVSMSNYYSVEDLTANLWLVYYPLCEALRVRNKQKAEQTLNAHIWYRRCLKLLVLPIVAFVICLIVFVVRQ